MRKVKNKLHLQKIMFLCAVARPRYVESLHGIWDGKVGIWAFTEQGQAIRNSVNRPAGTVITQNISVTKPVFCSYLAERLIPAIITEWPREYDGLGNMHPQAVKVQYDNCRVHVDPEEFSGMVNNVNTHGLD